MRRRSVRNTSSLKTYPKKASPLKKCLKCNSRIPAKSHVMSAVFFKKSNPKVIHFCSLDCMEEFDFDMYGKLN